MPVLRRSVEVQERDVSLLRDLFVSRLMTLAHVAALHFHGRTEAAKKRVQKLKAAGLIGERPRRARDPGILFLAKAGFDLLHDHGQLLEFPSLSWPAFERRSRVSELTLRHELAVMDVKSALAPAIGKTSGTSLIEFSTWPILHQFDVRLPGRGHATETRVKPDGLIRVEERTGNTEVYEHAFYLEVDRGTETLDTLGHRALCYREHYASGGYAVACGASRTAYDDYPFRVLMVFPSEVRRNNVTEQLLSCTPPIETQVWLAVMGDVATDPLGAIWIRPRDYRESMGVRASEVVRHARIGTHRRQPGREAQVRELVVHKRLFGD